MSEERRLLVEAVVDEAPHEYTCECGRKGTLWFNGGELDQSLCSCGVLHVLTYADAPLYYRAIRIERGT